jgi:hypothetical protein
MDYPTLRDTDRSRPAGKKGGPIVVPRWHHENPAVFRAFCGEAVLGAGFDLKRVGLRAVCSASPMGFFQKAHYMKDFS